MKTVLACDLQGAHPREAVEAGLDFLRSVWPDCVIRCCRAAPACTCRVCQVYPNEDQHLQDRYFPGSATKAVVSHTDDQLTIEVHEAPTSTVAKQLMSIPCWSLAVHAEVFDE